MTNKKVNDMIDVDMLKKGLYEGEVIVKFTKVDGSIREMRCTLKEIPADKQPKTTTESKENVNPSIMKVFDVENDGWRSFRLDSVISVSC